MLAIKTPILLVSSIRNKSFFFFFFVVVLGFELRVSYLARLVLYHLRHSYHPLPTFIL
jgi:hypothetical protein